MTRRPRRWRVSLAAAVTALVSCRAVAPPPAAPAPVATVADQFVLTFWCGPPLPDFTDERAAEIAAAGFNVVGAPCEGPFNPALNRRALDLAARHGLRLIIKDKRLSAYYALPSGWQREASAALADYRDHPGLAGFILIDEPGPERFDDIAALTRRIRREAPGAIAYVNLLPDYAVEDDLGAHGYRDYVEEFVLRTRPHLLSYDHYAFLEGGSDRPSFFANLATVRDVAREYDIPFLFILLAMPHGPYRDPSEAELRWQAFQALAFGARGISYFAYWTPVDVRDGPGMRFRHGLIEGGVATRHYFEAKRLNEQLRALADALDGFRPVAASVASGGAALPAGPLQAVDGDPLTAGVFRDRDGATAVVLVNQSYDAPARARLRLAEDAAAPRLLDPQTRRWSTYAGALSLPPGGAVLLRW